jgi:hypothetical protein
MSGAVGFSEIKKASPEMQEKAAYEVGTGIIETNFLRQTNTENWMFAASVVRVRRR